MILSSENEARMTSLMVETLATGTGTAARLPDRPSAGKTGTTQDFRDAWFVGYSADLTCGVWIGNDDNSSMHHAVGGGVPARIFRQFMMQAEAGVPAKPLPGARIEAAPETAQTTDQKKQPDDITKLLDRLFGGA